MGIIRPPKTRAPNSSTVLKFKTMFAALINTPPVCHHRVRFPLYDVALIILTANSTKACFNIIYFCELLRLLIDTLVHRRNIQGKYKFDGTFTEIIQSLIDSNSKNMRYTIICNNQYFRAALSKSF